jgi:NitT/TauT family transport system permease protein
MGSFEVVRSFFQPPINAIRYMPASAFIVLLIVLEGLGEEEKLTIIWIGVFFQLVLMVMDIAHRVPDEMLNVAYTLGASRWKVFYKVFLPATFPEVVDALRITIGWAWTYLIVAELLGAERGIGTFILISERFLRMDRIIAAILTIGVLGLITDTIFGLIHRWAFPYVEKVHA